MNQKSADQQPSDIARERRSPLSNDANQAPRAYAAPELFPVGSAYSLIQGGEGTDADYSNSKKYVG
jgi:hypothetical protein